MDGERMGCRSRRRFPGGRNQQYGLQVPFAPFVQQTLGQMQLPHAMHAFGVHPPAQASPFPPGQHASPLGGGVPPSGPTQ